MSSLQEFEKKANLSKDVKPKGKLNFNSQDNEEGEEKKKKRKRKNESTCLDRMKA